RAGAGEENTRRRNAAVTAGGHQDARHSVGDPALEFAAAPVSAFAYAGGELHVERVPLADLAARYGTPCYVYSRAAIEQAYREFDAAFAGTPHLVCYAVKANGNLAVLDVLGRLGSGFDIVSGGELARVRAAGGDAAR